MKRRSLFGTLTAVTASLALAGTVLAAGSFTNGSFEDGAYVESNSNGFMSAASGTVIDGWNITSPVDWIDWYWQAPEGTKSIDMNATPTAGSLSQTFDTAVNNTYVVEFKLSGNPMCGAGVKTMTVSSSTGASANYSFTVPTTWAYDTAGMVWIDASAFSFVATGASSTLTFASTMTSACGPAIDFVRVTETVATGALCKKGGWATMFDTVGNMFKNQGDCVSYYATDGTNLGAIAP